MNKKVVNKVKIFNNCGEDFYLLDTELLEKIIQSGEYEEIDFDRDDLINFFVSRVQFAEKNLGFHCGITKRSKMKKAFWDPFLFYEISQKWQRVVIENSGCTICDWKGIIANPTVPGLYYYTCCYQMILNY